MAKLLSQREVFGETLCELAEEFPDVICLDGDLATSTRADIFAARFPGKFFEMGIAEQNMVAAAAGLATMGFIPFISTFACFSAKRALDQVRVSVAQTHANVKLTGAYSGLLTGKTGKTHISVEDIAVMRAMPHMVTLVPADGVEVRQMMRTMVLTPGPMYLRLTRDPTPVLFDEGYRFEIGKGVVLREGRDATIISTGVQTARALEAAEELAREGISVYLLHLPTLKPLDEMAIVRAAQATGVVVTAEDHTILGGLGGAVAEVLGENHPTPMKRLGLRDCFGESGPDKPLLEKYGLTPAHVAQTVRGVLKAFKN